MNEDRLHRVVQKSANNTSRVFDLYDNKIVLLAQTEFVEARTSDDGKRILELILEGGPYFKVDDVMDFKGIKVKFKYFKIIEDSDLAKFFNIVEIEIYYDNLTSKPIRSIRVFIDKLLRKLRLKNEGSILYPRKRVFK
jgi:hypothetical protein